MSGEHLPHDLEAERALLGAVLHGSEEALDALTTTARPEHFFHEQHKIIARQVVEMIDNGKPVDLVTLNTRLVEKRLSERVGLSVLTSLFDDLPDTVNPQHYAETVRIDFARRFAVKAGRKLADLGMKRAKLLDIHKHLTDIVGHRWTDTLEPQLTAPTIDELLKMEFPQPRPLIDPILFENEILQFNATNGLGKTYLNLQLALGLAAGVEPFPGWTVPDWRPVLFVDGELPEEMTTRRLQELALGMQIDLAGLPIRVLSKVSTENSRRWKPLDTIEGQNELRLRLDKMSSEYGRKPFQILDPYERLTTASEGDNNEIRPFYDFLINLRAEGIATAYSMHQGHATGRARGASGHTGSVDSAVSLDRVKGSTGATFTMNIVKDRSYRLRAWPVSFQLVERHGGKVLEIFDPKNDKSIRRYAKTEEEILDFIGANPDATMSEVRGNVTGDDNVIGRLVRELIEEVKVINVGTAKSFKLRLPDTFNEDDGGVQF